MTRVPPADDAGFAAIPPDPGALLADWFEFARQHCNQPNWNVMYLATAGSDGQPSVRPVLHKMFDPATCALAFFTNYRSRKGREIAVNPRVGISMHWDHLDRAVRLEGPVEPCPPEISDAYFASRPRESQIGAWASDQSQEYEDWETLLSRVVEASQRFGGGEVPRPPHWGGYVLNPCSIEFWIGRPSRIHERVEYCRDVRHPTGWRPRRLYP